MSSARSLPFAVLIALLALVAVPLAAAPAGDQPAAIGLVGPSALSATDGDDPACALFLFQAEGVAAEPFASPEDQALASSICGHCSSTSCVGATPGKSCVGPLGAGSCQITGFLCAGSPGHCFCAPAG
jgi:hypothetical protein